MSGKGAPPDVNGTRGGMQNLQIETKPNGITDSPESTSPVASTVPGPPRQPTSAAGVLASPRHVPSAAVNGAPSTKDRPTSMYSQWDEDGADGAESEEDEGAFLTPEGGLSEVEEEDEHVDEAVSKPVNGHVGTAVNRNGTEEAVTKFPSPTANVKTIENGIPAANSDTTGEMTNPTLAATDVVKGASATNADVSGTGRSTIHRNKPVVSETRVRKRAARNKGDALVVDQAAVLAHDLEICRQVLTLFLTSHMKDAEDMCFDEDPDGNHLYLISGHGIINALKVGLLLFRCIQAEACM